MESLTRYSTENKTLFYRSRFALSPDSESAGEIWPSIIQAIQGWLEEKEEQFEDDGRENLLSEITSDVVNIGENIEGAVGKYYANEQLAKGAFDQETISSKITTKAVFTNRKDVPAYWVLEYIEQSKRDWYRRWFTNVGVTDIGDGSYIVNTRVAIADDPTFIRDQPEIPQRNTPRFIAKLLEATNVVATSNGIELNSEPKPLTSCNFDRFEQDLTSPDRTVPFVVVSAMRDQQGRYATDPYKLAKELRGSAVVYMLDCSEYYTRQAYRDVFLRNDSTSEYRINNGFMRVFFPGVNLNDPQGGIRHRYYTQDCLEKADQKAIANDICGAITRLYRRVQGEAIDLASLDAIQARISREQLERKFRESEKARAAEKIQPIDLEGLHTEAEFKAAIEEVQKRATVQQAEDADFYNEYIKDLEKQIDRLQNNEDLLDALIQIDNLNEENRALRSTVNAKEHTIATLQAKASASAATASDMQEQANIVRSLNAFPQNTREALDLAKTAFANELAFTREAEQSALEDGKNADASEVFNILRALAVNLWPKFFEHNKNEGNAEKEFKNETGLNLTFHESSTTNKDSRLKNQRFINYNGKQVNISPHVKGKSGNRDRKLRIHFAVDRNTRKLVIGHCGAHKETAGTRKVK